MAIAVSSHLSLQTSTLLRCLREPEFQANSSDHAHVGGMGEWLHVQALTPVICTKLIDRISSSSFLSHKKRIP